MSAVTNTISFLLHYDYALLLFILKIIAGVASFWLFIGIAYNAYYTKKTYRAMYGSLLAPLHKVVLEKNSQNLVDWEKILARGSSPDESERKLAVIAADALIERMITLAGYTGEGLGEKLKKIESSDLDSLQDIWEAHKVRNRIAHEVDYRLSLAETEGILKRFEKALKELQYI